MIYATAQDYLSAPHKQVLLFGMSGLGKTTLSNMLRDADKAQGGHWFHYSVDYRIGTRYMGEYISDNFKREAMKVPLLRELLMSIPSTSPPTSPSTIWPRCRPTLANREPRQRAGLPFAEYQRRQAEHAQAEVAAMLDTTRSIARAKDIYGYNHFICDTSRLDLRGGRGRRPRRSGDARNLGASSARVDQGLGSAPRRALPPF